MAKLAKEKARHSRRHHSAISQRKEGGLVQALKFETICPEISSESRLATVPESRSLEVVLKEDPKSMQETLKKHEPFPERHLRRTTELNELRIASTFQRKSL